MTESQIEREQGQKRMEIRKGEKTEKGRKQVHMPQLQGQIYITAHGQVKKGYKTKMPQLN